MTYTELMNFQRDIANAVRTQEGYQKGGRHGLVHEGC
jgi:hypothetical protein